MLKAYKMVTVLLVTDFCLYALLGLSLAGQLSDKILFWVWLLMTVLVSIKYLRHTKWLKRYLVVLGVIIALSLIPMTFPFLRLVEFATEIKLERRIENYRLRGDQDALMLGKPTIKVVRNLGIIEWEYYEIDFDQMQYEDDNYSLASVGEIRLKKQGDDQFLELELDGHFDEWKLEFDRYIYLL